MTFNVRRNTRPKATTHEGAKAFHMNADYELYLLVVSSLMSGDSFYESADDRVARFRDLVSQVVAAGNIEFLVGLAAYAREQMFLRTTPTVLVAEMFMHRLEEHGLRAAKRVWTRGDEHLEALAYVDTTGSKRTKAFLRAIAGRLGAMSEYQFVKYASTRKAYSQRDAIRVSHPIPTSRSRSALYKYVVHGWDELTEEERGLLPEVAKVKDGEAATWEQLISDKGSTTAAWTEAVKVMGYMALLRNLRNLIENKVPTDELRRAACRIADPAAVAKSKQLPFRYLSAYLALPADSPPYMIDAVSNAADAAVRNVPDLEGDSLVCVDVSGSMQSPVSGRSKVSCMEAAACLGAIFAHGGACDLWAFGTTAARVKVPAGNPVISTTLAVTGATSQLGWGTNIGLALESGLRPGLKRAIVLTDMQTHDYAMGPAAKWLKENPEAMLYIVDLSSYGRPCFDPHFPNVVMVGGFSDRVFEWMAAMEEKNPLQKVKDYGSETE